MRQHLKRCCSKRGKLTPIGANMRRGLQHGMVMPFATAIACGECCGVYGVVQSGGIK
jgi:hypothetical protein